MASVASHLTSLLLEQRNPVNQFISGIQGKNQELINKSLDPECKADFQLNGYDSYRVVGKKDITQKVCELFQDIHITKSNTQFLESSDSVVAVNLNWVYVDTDKTEKVLSGKLISTTAKVDGQKTLITSMNIELNFDIEASVEACYLM